MLLIRLCHAPTARCLIVLLLKQYIQIVIIIVIVFDFVASEAAVAFECIGVAATSSFSFAVFTLLSS